ncbi:ABC transporter substrate-binding protein [Streptomyces sp. BI20]|uniref:ABC transporter substrate-binding protein n=1 Tax=Streptomyces sp. BI20 TaxID=3403460 RepID=UPI003C70FA36
MTRPAAVAGRARLAAIAALTLLPLFAVTACGSGNTATGGADKAAPAGAQGGGPAPASTDNPVAEVKKVDAIAALLPADVRAKGSLRIGTSVGAPPSAYYPNGQDKPPAGQDIDLADAAAKVLGITLERQDASFETILPALGSGKYDLGTGNFGVTTERLKTIDFVTYINDGQGFAVKTGGDRLTKPVKDLTDLCGLIVGTGAGTTFEKTLTAKKDVCEKAGKKPYEVKVFSDNGATVSALRQGRVDTVMSTINGLRYQASQPAAQTTFLGEFKRLDVGFAFKKGTPLAPAFQAAVNELVKNGTYERILRKWGTQESAIPKSEINPAELS